MIRYVLESPHEVHTFQYNPVNPDIIIGGCYNGQVIVWDTSSSPAVAAAASRTSHGGGGKGGGVNNNSGSSSSSCGARASSKAGGRSGGSCAPWDDSGEPEAATPVIKHK